MNRKEFIHTCGMACIGGGLLSTILQACTGSKMISGTLKENELTIPLTAFKTSKTGSSQYLIVHHEQLQYPICIYRLPEGGYSALWMSCPHQGAELQAFGDKLVCPAHGSEFSSHGDVQSGPADKALRQFNVTQEDNQLRISLK